MYNDVHLSIVYYSEKLETSETLHNRDLAKLITFQTFNGIPRTHKKKKKKLCSLKVFNDLETSSRHIVQGRKQITKQYVQCISSLVK